jgi:hypothetical protein
MSRYKQLGVLAGCLVGIVVLCALRWSQYRAPDEVKYRRSVHSLRAAIGRQQFMHRLPRFVRARLREIMVDRPAEAYRAREQAFLASGFLTNVAITWTDASATFSNGVMISPTRDEVMHLFLTVVQEDDFLLTKLAKDYRTRRVTVELVCPKQYVPLLSKAVGTPTPNRVGGRIDLPPPTPPSKRVRTRRFRLD